MFLKQLPRYGDWKILAASLATLAIAGCANLTTVPDTTDQSSAAVAIPLQTQEPAVETGSGPYQNFDDFSEAAAFAGTQPTLSDSSPEFPTSMPLVEVPMDLDIEIEANLVQRQVIQPSTHDAGIRLVRGGDVVLYRLAAVH